MISIDALLSAETPFQVRYCGMAEVKPALRSLTVVGWKDLNIGPLSEEGSKAAEVKGGGLMWILDLVTKYEMDQPA